MRCKNCGAKISRGKKYCGKCGQAVAGKRNRRLLPVILLVFLLVIGGGSAAVFYFGVIPGIGEEESYIGVEKGSGLTFEEAEQILLSDFTDENWETFDAVLEELSAVAAEYLADDGYVEEENTETAVNAVAAKVDQFYEEGVIVYYIVDSDTISFEFDFGLTGYYTPALEGYSSSGDDISILAIDPFENDSTNETMTNQAYIVGEYIDSVIEDADFESLENEEVTLDAVKNLSESDFFLWNGHGGYISIYGIESPVLATREQPTSGILAPYGYSLSVTDVIAAIGPDGNKTNYWSVSPYFVEKYIELNNSLVYLSTCYSGANNLLASAFFNAGAEVVFVNVGDSAVLTYYTQAMMSYIISYMSGVRDGIYYTAEEALSKATETFDQDIKQDTKNSGIKRWEEYTSLGELIEFGQSGVYTDIRGEGDYTVVSGIRGEVSFPDEMTANERSEVIDSLTVQLELGTATGYLSVSGLDMEIEEDGTFYFNKLEPGNYRLALYQSGEQISEYVELTVAEHRYVSVTLAYAELVQLEGYVYDEDGNALSGVHVSAELSSDADWWNVTAQTDRNGYYQIEVFGENTYTLNYSLGGYTSVENSFSVTEAIYENAQKGNPAELEDVVLEWESDIPADAVSWNGHHYYYYDTSCSWEEAEVYCESVGGHLVTITSAEEQKFVYNYAVSVNGAKRIFIGLSDADEEGDWSEWVNGEAVSYTNWGTGQPDDNVNSADVQNYGTIYTQYENGENYEIQPGQWDDINTSCTFICEWDY